MSKLKNLRDAKNLTMEALAEAIGTTASQINKLEKGQRKLSLDWAKKLAPILSVSPFELLDVEDDAKYDMRLPPAGGFSEARPSAYTPKIPVWGVVDAQDGERYAINMEDTPVEWIEPLPMQSADKAAFAVLVAGESMSPKYEPGNIACVNTRKPAIKGQDCIIEFTDGSGMIKKYIGSSADEYIFEQLNPHKQLKFKKKDIVRILPVVGVIFR